MASNNQLRARVRDRHLESIGELAEEREISETDAERIVVREGLARLGYLDEPGDPAGAFLDFARKSGTILGFVGLILIGYGLFGLASFRYIGFGLVLSGFGLIAGAEYAVAIKGFVSGPTDTETTA